MTRAHIPTLLECAVVFALVLACTVTAVQLAAARGERDRLERELVAETVYHEHLLRETERRTTT